MAGKIYLPLRSTLTSAEAVQTTRWRSDVPRLARSFDDRHFRLALDSAHGGEDLPAAAIDSTGDLQTGSHSSTSDTLRSGTGASQNRWGDTLHKTASTIARRVAADRTAGAVV